jgi:hypothetical protein
VLREKRRKGEKEGRGEVRGGEGGQEERRLGILLRRNRIKTMIILKF